MQKKHILSLILFIIVLSVNAQTNQFGTWSSISLDKKLTKKWDIGAGTELRTIYGVRLINRWSLDINTQYKINKLFDTKLSYELMNVLDQKYLNYQIRHRFNADIEAGKKWGDFSFGLSEGVQITTKNASKRLDEYGIIDTYKINPAWIWKNNFETEYNIPKCKLTPGVGFSTYYTLNDPDGNNFEKIRYKINLKYKINKRNFINLFGVYNQELGTDEADYSGKYNLGVKYVIHL